MATKEQPLLMNEANFTNDPRFSAPAMRKFLEKGCFRYVEKPMWPKKKTLIKRALKLKITCREANDWVVSGKPIERLGPGGENEHDDEKVGEDEDNEGADEDDGDEEDDK